MQESAWEETYLNNLNRGPEMSSEMEGEIYPEDDAFIQFSPPTPDIMDKIQVEEVPKMPKVNTLVVDKETMKFKSDITNNLLLAIVKEKLFKNPSRYIQDNQISALDLEATIEITSRLGCLEQMVERIEGEKKRAKLCIHLLKELGPKIEKYTQNSYPTITVNALLNSLETSIENQKYETVMIHKILLEKDRNNLPSINTSPMQTLWTELSRDLLIVLVGMLGNFLERRFSNNDELSINDEPEKDHDSRQKSANNSKEPAPPSPKPEQPPAKKRKKDIF